MSAAPPPKPRLGNLTLRLLTAAVGIPVVLALILVGGWPFILAVAALLAVGAGEVTHALGLRLRDPLTVVCVAATAGLAIAAAVAADTVAAELVLLVMLSLSVMVLAARTEGGFSLWSGAVAAVVYVGILGSHLVSLRLAPDGQSWLLMAVLMTFATDTGAYALGRLLGRRKLAPRVSPGKTVAGAWGGVAAAAGAAVVLNAALGLAQPPAAMLALGVLVAVAAEIGDLGESLIKRSLGVKDMGRIFPGHGGVLDRLDSLLFVVPVVYYWVRWIVQ